MGFENRQVVLIQLSIMPIFPSNTQKCVTLSTGPLKKLFHYAIFQKFFHILYHTFMVYVLLYVLLNVYAILFL